MNLNQIKASIYNLTFSGKKNNIEEGGSEHHLQALTYPKSPDKRKERKTM